MRAAVIVALALVVAGCADEGRPSDDDDFDDVPVEVDENTGAIRGVVVDQSIVPVAGATITLVGTDKQAVTDAEGRFAFSKLDPGFYLINASKPLFRPTEVQEEVLAGDPEPRVLRMQMTRLFSGEPFVLPFESEGYFTCSQARVPGYLYSSSSCHDNNLGGYAAAVSGQPVPSTDGSDYGIILDQIRDFHQDVAPGWQTMVFEMTWEPSAQGTSDRMGMVVSTYKPERPTNHWFANVDSGNPMRFQLDVGVEHENSQQGDGEWATVPADGLEDMSFFTSVRPPEGAQCPLNLWCVPPGIAYEQDFYVYLHQFVYLPAPAEWSIVAGDSTPF